MLSEAERGYFRPSEIHRVASQMAEVVTLLQAADEIEDKDRQVDYYMQVEVILCEMDNEQQT